MPRMDGLTLLENINKLSDYKSYYTILLTADETKKDSEGQPTDK